MTNQKLCETVKQWANIKFLEKNQYCQDNQCKTLIYRFKEGCKENLSLQWNTLYTRHLILILFVISLTKSITQGGKENLQKDA